MATEFVIIPTSELAYGIEEKKPCFRCGGLMSAKRVMQEHTLFQCPCCGMVKRFSLDEVF